MSTRQERGRRYNAYVKSPCSHASPGQGRSLRAGPCTKASPASEVSGRPFRMRADHSWPQRRQLYHAMTQVLSGAGSTDRPQTGHDVAAVTGNDVDDMSIRRATIVPLRYGVERAHTCNPRVSPTGNYRHQRGIFRPISGRLRDGSDSLDRHQLFFGHKGGPRYLLVSVV